MKLFRISGGIALLYSIYNGLAFINYLKNPGIALDVGILIITTFIIYMMLAIAYLFLPSKLNNSSTRKSAYLSFFLPFIIILFSYSPIALGLADSVYLRPVIILVNLIPLYLIIKGVLKENPVIFNNK